MRSPTLDPPVVSTRQHGEAVAQAAIARLALRGSLVGRGSPWAEYVDKPVKFAQEILHETLWSKQIEILNAVRDHRRVAVHSAHECSKSFTAARIVAWWLSTHAFGEAFAVTTAPSSSQVRSILWREIGRAYNLGKLTGRLNQVEWMMDPTWSRYKSSRGSTEEIVAYGRKPSDYDPNGFQGIHARFVLALIDEACGVPEALWRSIGSLTGNDNSRILAIGNPDDSSSYFAEVCKPGSGWHVIHVDGLESPNFTEERQSLPREVLEQLLGPIYVEELRNDVGEESAVFKSKVRGIFAADDPQGVVPLSFVRRCQIEKDWPAGSDLPIELGVDVGAGGDETVIRERRGVHARRNWRYSTPNWADAVNHVLDAIQATGATKVKVDVAGIGWGVVGRLMELKGQSHEAEIVGINVGTASTDPTRFPKLRDQIWWEVGRELSRDHAWDLSLVDDKTVAQLIAPQYDRDTASRIKVESKTDTRKRLRRSPDDADALLLAYASVGVEAADVSSDPPEERPDRPRYTMFRRII